MSCDYGSVPSQQGQVLRVISYSQENEEYSVYMRINAKKPWLSWKEIPVPQFNDNRYYLEVDVKVPSQILCGRDLFDDMNKNAYQFIQKEEGSVNYFMTDESNYLNFSTRAEFEAFIPLMRVIRFLPASSSMEIQTGTVFLIIPMPCTHFNML